MLKPISLTRDQAKGLIWRWLDKDFVQDDDIRSAFAVEVEKEHIKVFKFMGARHFLEDTYWADFGWGRFNEEDGCIKTVIVSEAAHKDVLRYKRLISDKDYG